MRLTTGMAFVLAALAATATAAPPPGRLPLESFTVAQGLPSDSVNAIRLDSRGFLWFATLDGLSRYDGNAFVNYTTAHGIPDRMVWAVDEDRDGGLWIATSEGPARMTTASTRGRHLFQRVPLAAGVSRVSTEVFVDRKGTVWSSCGETLCAFRNGRMEIETGYRGTRIGSITEDQAGNLWIGTGSGLFRRAANGTWRSYAVQPVGGIDGIGGVAIDRDGRLWIATGYGFVAWLPGGDEHDPRPLIERAGKVLTPGDPIRLPQRGEVVAITKPSPFPIICRTPLLGRDGSVWQTCVTGLFHVANGSIAFYDTSDGLPYDFQNVAEDAHGDIWIGTRGSGALRLARAGAITWTRAHGLANQRIRALFELDDKTVCAANQAGVSCFGDGAIRHASLWPIGVQQGWGWNQIAAPDPDGTLWVASPSGVIRWPRVQRVEDLGRTAPMKIYTTRDGFGSDNVFRVFRDSRGRIWTGAFEVEKPLSRREADGRVVSFGPEHGVTATPTAFAEDRAGNVWIGLYEGGFLRVAGDRVERIAGDLPRGLVRDLEVDSAGGLWIGTASGLARIADPTAPANRLQVRRYSQKDGLASDSAYCMVELPDGRMAIGSQRGLDVLDVRTGNVVHVSIREGLASNEVSVALVDRRGALWLGTVNGLSRLDRIPAPRFVPPPRLRIDSIHIDGAPIAVAELGATSVGGVRIEYPRHAMQVGFSAPHYDPSRPLHFEYRLSPDAPWTVAGTQRAILFDRLPSGRGVLEIRAVTSAGRRSEPSRVSFVVVPTVWKRPWFLALMIATAVMLAFGAHRYRVAQVVALERVRTRAATDLHDDLGSSLSRISILSEVAKRKLKSAGPEPLLDEIADSARGLVDALGDNIWSIDPKRDDVRSLLMRVRHFAAAVFESQSIAIDVQMAPEVAAMPLKPEQRRETYLILKEALNNAAKHARASRVAVLANADGRTLRIAVEDDGRGFAEGREGGRGLPSMSDRARRAGGRLEIASKPGEGTRVLLTVPL
jgi:ligand-binding sensor domain-containing protein/signal transduction histidine kinase